MEGIVLNSIFQPQTNIFFASSPQRTQRIAAFLFPSNLKILPAAFSVHNLSYCICVPSAYSGALKGRVSLPVVGRQLPDALLQRVFPVGYFDAEGVLDLGLVEDGEVGAFHLAGELVAVAGLDVAGVAAQFADFPGEVVPRADAFVAEVVDALLAELSGFDDAGNRVCQIAGVCGGAHLVEHHFQAVLLGGELLHGLHEVLAERRVEPGGADDDVPASGAFDALFSGKLGDAVYSQRVGFPVFPAGGAAVALEHIVGGYVDEGRVVFSGCDCQVLNRFVVDQVGSFAVVFRFVHVGVGGAVHDDLYAVVFYGSQHGFTVGDVELGYVSEYVMVGAGFCHALHFVAELAVCSGY